MSCWFAWVPLVGLYYKAQPGAISDRMLNVGPGWSLTNITWNDLEFGTVERHGIRCCYHGWLYGVDGKVLETPGEPAEGCSLSSMLGEQRPFELRVALEGGCYGGEGYASSRTNRFRDAGAPRRVVCAIRDAHTPVGPGE